LSKTETGVKDLATVKAFIQSAAFGVMYAMYAYIWLSWVNVLLVHTQTVTWAHTKIHKIRAYTCTVIAIVFVTVICGVIGKAFNQKSQTQYFVDLATVYCVFPLTLAVGLGVVGIFVYRLVRERSLSNASKLLRQLKFCAIAYTVAAVLSAAFCLYGVLQVQNGLRWGFFTDVCATILDTIVMIVFNPFRKTSKASSSMSGASLSAEGKPNTRSAPRESNTGSDSGDISIGAL